MKQRIDILDSYITCYRNWPVQGQTFYDLKELYRNPGSLSEAAFQLASQFFGKADVVMTPECSIALGHKVASHLFLPLVIARNNLPSDDTIVSKFEDRQYTIWRDDIPRGSDVLIVTEVIDSVYNSRPLYDLALVTGAKSIGWASLLKVGLPDIPSYSIHTVREEG